jgi:tRNA1(Val) A37 N6-methylase TrmN6
MSHLFSKIVITDALKNLQITDIESKISILRDWLDMYNSGSLQKKSEKEFEWVYNESLFGNILGYTSASNGEYTREKEPRNDSNGQKCDIGLWWYSSNSSTTQAVVELKDAGTSLDRPQQRAGNLTPVQQAFKYKPLYNSKWVIVSNFYEIRLYTDTYKDYESFTLKELVDARDDYASFRKFYLLFHAESLIARDTESRTENLLAKVRIEEEKISKEFYREYKTLRLELMRDIWKYNTGAQNASVIEMAQRIIDRIVFICFCEDRGLLPQHELASRIQKAKEIGFSPWDMLKKFFIQIDSWDATMQIPDGYNGWLFRQDSSIDNLRISDAIVEKFIALGRYDFSEDGGELSVEILGHIFEQSISDIEEIRTQIENKLKVEEIKETEKKVSKRKKDGIFYTPAYIVEYIVENSLGRYMREHEEWIIEKYKLKESITEKNYQKREFEAYTEYQKILQNVKVLDPACGSGAFLVRVFDWLLAENKRVASILTGDGQASIFQSEDYFRDILRNNIYGVDLNAESVEITKLSLWLKSAVRGKKLVTLDNNIKCGNSLIDDPAVAGDKAFDWNTEFADIMADGGFDVIVGNPPYVQSRNIKSPTERNYLWNKYRTDTNHSDLYSFFIELSLQILNWNWTMSFIIPSTILAIPSFKSIREYIITNAQIKDIVTFNEVKVFEDAIVNPIIISFYKSKKEQDTTIHDYNQSVFSFKKTIPVNKLSWDYIIDLNHSENKTTIINKINKHEILDNMYRLIWWIRTWDDSRFINTNLDSSDSRRLIRWRDFSKYYSSWNGEYIWYRPDLMKEKQAAAPKESAFFEVDKKILIRMISGENFSATLDKQWLYLLQDNIVLEKTEEMSLEYLLVLINSKMIEFFLTTSNIAVTQSMLWKLKIPKISLDKQQPFIDRADMMLSLNKELHEKSSAFLANISAKYQIEKITRKLEKWWELDFSDFVREMKTKLSLEEQEELMKYFDKRKSEVRDIAAKIEATDKEIDEMVFELYWLTEEERKVVLESR